MGLSPERLPILGLRKARKGWKRKPKEVAMEGKGKKVRGRGTKERKVRNDLEFIGLKSGQTLKHWESIFVLRPSS